MITDQNTDQVRNVSLSYLWPTRDMAASLLSVPVPVSVVVAAPPLLANRRNPRLLGLWLALGSSLDL